MVPTDRSRSGYSLSLFGKAVPVTILVKATNQKKAKREEEAKSWQGQRKMNR